MPHDVRYPGSLTLPGLQNELNNSEALFLKLKALAADGSDTIGEFDQVDVELPPLQLLFDPAHNVPAPAGTVVVCRGEAMIQNTEQKVSAFRPSS